MTRKKTRLLVVDASVVHSAGETDHPISSSCRKCLEAILRICHRVAVTPAIRKEWKPHMSRFSRKWHLSMTTRRKIQKDIMPASAPIDTSLYGNSARAQIEKDLCLLEAALAAERIIVTRDDKLQRALAQRPDGVKLLRAITWFNPVTEDASVLEAL